MAQMFVAEGFLETCRGLQEIIDAQDSREDQNAAGLEAVQQIGSKTPFETRMVILGGEAALALPDKTDPLEEQIRPVVQYGQLITRGRFGRPNFIRLKDEAFLAWSIYDPSIIGPVGEFDVAVEPEESEEQDLSSRLPVDTVLRRTLHFPVSLIDYVMCYDDRLCIPSIAR